jgi:hypothetical protein
MSNAEEVGFREIHRAFLGPSKAISIPACLSRLYSHKRYLSTNAPVG